MKKSKEKNINKQNQNSIWLNIIVIIIIILVYSETIFDITYSLTSVYIPDTISSFEPRKQYLRDMKLVEGVIVSKVTKHNKSYVKVVANDYAKEVYFNDENSYVEVNSQFYNDKFIGDTVGILAGKYETFKPQYWGIFGNKKQYLQKIEWYIDGICNSLAEAKQANPVKTYKQKVTLIKKKELKTGEKFFVMKVDDRTIKEKVDIVIFEKHKENDTLECYFESTGDFSKFLRIIE